MLGPPRLALLPLLAAAPGLCAPSCPDGSERVATSWPERPWVCALVEAIEPGGDCPQGTSEVTVPSAPRPFRCALDGRDPEPPAGGCPRGQRAVADGDGRTRCVRQEGRAEEPKRPRCPKGFAPAFTRDSKRGYRCVPAAAGRDEADGAAAVSKPARLQAPGASKPGAACPPGTRRVRTEDPFEPLRCEPAVVEPAPPLKSSYARYEVPRELVFEYPDSWNVTDAWKDEVPSIYIQPDLRRDGKPVILTVSRYRADRSPYPDMDSAIRKEIDWHGAREGGRGPVAGLPARFLEVPNQARSAYVKTATGYFVLSFSAPEDLFRAYAPAYSRLLRSLRVVHEDTDPMPEEE